MWGSILYTNEMISVITHFVRLYKSVTDFRWDGNLLTQRTSSEDSFQANEIAVVIIFINEVLSDNRRILVEEAAQCGALYFVLINKYYYADQIKENEVGGHVARMGEESVQGSGGKA
jgi:hypothetical protein